MIEIKFKYYIFDTSMRYRGMFDSYEDARNEVLFWKEMKPNEKFMILKYVEER